MKPILLAAALAIAIPAQAQVYKCNEGGKVVFSDQPCAGAGQQLNVRPASGAAPAADPAPSASPAGERINASSNPQAVVARMERERRVDRLARDIRDLEDSMEADRRRADSELANLQNKKRYANNNLAGATWEASISQEMQALTQRHQVKALADTAKLQQLRKEREQLTQP